VRVFYLVHQYPPEHVGGTELYTRSLARELSQRGHQITVFHRRNVVGVGQKVWSDEGVRVWSAWAGALNPTRCFLATFGEPALERALERALDESQPDLVHVQHLMGLPVTLLRMIRRRGIPFVITLHDFWWVCANAQLLTNDRNQVCAGPRAYVNCTRCALARSGQARFLPALPAIAGLLAWRNHLLRQGLSSAEVLLSPTEFVSHWYAAHGTPKAKLAVMPLGVDRHMPIPLLEPRPEGPMRFVYIGGIAPQKGVHVIVEAFRELRGDTELWIAGDEAFDPAYTQQLRSRASPRVCFLGKLDRAEVWRTLKSADAAVIPSLWYETFSLIAHEAFAAGVPVLASRLGALAEVVKDGLDGLLIPPGDVSAWRTALQSLIDDPGRLAFLRAQVRPPLTVEQHASQIEALYGQLLNARSPRP